MNRQLEIGPGSERLEGDWTTLDCVKRPGVVDVVCRWGEERLPFPDNTFELVHAAHVLEHVPWYQTVDALREAKRVLRPGGTLELHVPNFDVLIRAARSRSCLDDHAESGLNGELHWMHWVAERLFHLGEEYDWHKACFNGNHLKWCLEKAGFGQITSGGTERGLSHGVVDLAMTAIKPTTTEQKTRSEVPERAMQDDGLPKGNPGTLEGLPYCHSRREYDRDATYFCAHPNVHVAGSLVTRDICRICTRWQEPPPETPRPFGAAARDGPCWHLGDRIGLRSCTSCRGNIQIKVFSCGHPDHESTTVKDCLRCPDYERRLKRGRISRWAVGMTTAPRRNPTLERTLGSLERAGWSDLRLFAEPDSCIPKRFCELPITLRDTKLGAWPNWFLALSELYQRDTAADAYLLLQDDVVFCRNLRAYLERVLWPDETVGVVSLYNPLKDGDGEPGFLQRSSADGLRGALALCFPNYAVRLLLSDAALIGHRRNGETNGARLIDVVIGRWADQSGLATYYHAPSLAQHIGDTTTIWSSSQDKIARQSKDFVGEEFDAMSLIGRSPSSVGAGAAGA